MLRTLLISGLVAGLAAVPAAVAERPHVILLSVDTLRADRLSAYGYERLTSPRIDALLERGIRFEQARTPVPLTAPAMASVFTSLEPHDHGSTRNGLRVRPQLVSFSRLLERRGYRAAAVVGNWTLRPELSGLDDFFSSYQTLLTRKRWLGLLRRESKAEDLNAAALAWLDRHLEADAGRPFLLWVHYVEPHAPYALHGPYLEQLGVKRRGSVFSAGNRYDSEIAYVDDQIGRLLDAVFQRVEPRQTLVVFLADHGESLGDHGYWGHGRHVYDATLRVPLGLVWEGRLQPRSLSESASLLDVAPTVLGLVGLESPPHFAGFDWTEVVLGRAEPQAGRVTWHQSHRASVQPQEEIERLRQKGLLEVARLAEGEKEIFRVPGAKRRQFDLVADPAEERSLVSEDSPPSPDLLAWLDRVRAALAVADELPPPSLTEEDIEALKALGYIE